MRQKLALIYAGADVNCDRGSILLDEPHPGNVVTRDFVPVFDQVDEDREEWLFLSSQRLAAAYAEDEPEYPLSSVKEKNLEYRGT